ncbi:MAG: DUF2069 domain-containing protein [Burkholderiaceae bacterium]
MRLIAILLTIALAILAIAWETWLAPVRPGAWILATKALPLLVLLPGLLGPRTRPWQWLSLLVLAYVCEGLVRATSERGLSATLATIEVVLSATLFVLVLVICRRARLAGASAHGAVESGELTDPPGARKQARRSPP